jgi:hypothetical protein
MYCNQYPIQSFSNSTTFRPDGSLKKDPVTIFAEQILDFRFYAKKLWYLCTVFRHRYK